MRSSRVLPWMAVAMLAFGCGEDSGDVDRTPPEAPRMRSTNCSDAGAVLPETGVDAEGASGIRLEWDLEPEPEDLAGFAVYRSWHPDSAFSRLILDEERFLEGRPDYYHHVDLDPLVFPAGVWGARAWYYVRALDEDGNMGAASDTVSYRLWAAPRVRADQLRVAGDSLVCSWQYEFVDYFAYGFRGFRVLIADAAGTLRHSEDVLLNLEPQMSASWPRTRLGLEPGTYRLRVDTLVDMVPSRDSLHVEIPSNLNDCPLAGSESDWISFTFPAPVANR